MKEQYYIYDGNALIADIGGYFCMFLSLSKFLSAFLEFFMMKTPGVKKKLRSPGQISPAQNIARTLLDTPMGGITRI